MFVIVSDNESLIFRLSGQSTKSLADGIEVNTFVEILMSSYVNSGGFSHSTEHKN